MAATRAIHFQHSHQRNITKPWMHWALAVINYGVSVWWEMHVEEDRWARDEQNGRFALGGNLFFLLLGRL
jgi:hypothetical protein